MASWIAIAIGAVGVPLILHQTHKFIIEPRRRATKLRRLYHLVEEWHDYIDRNLESGINRSHLNSLEQKVSDYIKDHGLGGVLIRFDEDFRRRYLTGVGIAKEFQADVATFRRYARAQSDKIDLGSWWLLLSAAGWRFLGNFEHLSPDTNWADIQMQLRILKQFTGVRAE